MTGIQAWTDEVERFWSLISPDIPYNARFLLWNSQLQSPFVKTGRGGAALPCPESASSAGDGDAVGGAWTKSLSLHAPKLL